MYKVGDRVICSVENQKDGIKRILIKEPLKDSKVIKKEFVIVHSDEVTQFYTVIVDDDMVGWVISKWHIKYWDIDVKFLNKRFYDVPEILIEGKGKK